jgi:hypothetical protein
MSRKKKQIERLLSKPKDFTYNELSNLLKGLGYMEDRKGKTSGSRVAFINPSSFDIIRLDKPHLGNELKAYIINYIIRKLKENGDI